MIGVGEAPPAARQEGRERPDVVAVGLDGVRREPALEMEVVHERVDRPGIRGPDDYLG
jgi:hypothetical protein